MKYVLIILTFMLVSCAKTPQDQSIGHYSNIKPKIPDHSESMGSIYQPIESDVYTYQSMFEDSRPRNVGDLLTVELKEDFNASNSSSTNAGQSGTGPSAPSLWDILLGNQSAAVSMDTYQGSSSGDASAQNAMSGTITVTVSGVLSNGNLKVVGEKQITINRGTKYIRFSGVVNPKSITQSNTVPSTQIADARVEYVDFEAPLVGWWQRFLSSLSPAK